MMIGKAALIVSLALSLADGCGRPGGDASGDGNPNTGECEISYSETMAGKRHSYPERVEKTNFVFGKILVECKRTPKTHHIAVWLETKGTGGGEWERRGHAQETNGIPAPKHQQSVQTNCKEAVTAWWRLHANIKGSGVTEKGGQTTKWDFDDYSPERLLECPKQ